MQTKTSQVVVITNQAIETAVRLIGQFNEKAKADPIKTASLFARLRQLLAALPLNQAEGCFFHNTMADCETLAGGGEPLVARRQMVQVVRKLRTYRERWQRGLVVVVHPRIVSIGQ